jgi:hypothetical protein
MFSTYPRAAFAQQVNQCDSAANASCYDNYQYNCNDWQRKECNDVRDPPHTITHSTSSPSCTHTTTTTTTILAHAFLIPIATVALLFSECDALLAYDDAPARAVAMHAHASNPSLCISPIIHTCSTPPACSF